MQTDTRLLSSHYSAAPLVSAGADTPMSREYLRLLQNYLPYVRANLKPWPGEPGAKYHKRDGSAEHDVRQNATVAFGLAVLARHGEPQVRSEALADAAALVRYLAVTHKANFLPTGDGKQWGDHWQSAYWAAYAGKAAWLVWNELDDETKTLVARMVVHEAGRFNTRPPDDGEWHDTKAEENAWNSQIIALARCIFPKHPDASVWDVQAKRWMMNSFSTRADHSDDTLVDGKPIREWVTTVCIHDDFTLENHNRVHPDYMMGTISLLLRNVLFYKAAGLEVPGACFHHVRDVFHATSALTSTNGSHLYVNGQDWWPHRHDVPLGTGGLLAATLGNLAAAFMERGALGSLKEMHSRFSDGRAFDKREYNYPNIEEELIARYSELYLAHRMFGDTEPSSRDEFLRSVSGARVFDAGGFVIDRNQERFASFAWVNSAMGLVYVDDDTWFTSPDTRSLLGHITVTGAKDSNPVLEEHSIRTLSGDAGFAFRGSFLRCEGAVRQLAAMVALPSGPVLYVERLVALRDVNVEEIATGRLVILNEQAPGLAPGQRVIRTDEGKVTIAGASEMPAETLVWKTGWADLDGKLCVSAIPEGTMRFVANHTFAGSRLNQELAAHHRPSVGICRQGDVISHCAVALVPGKHSGMPEGFTMETLGKPIVTVRLGGWVVAVNFGGTRVDATCFGVRMPLDAGAVVVERAGN